MTTYRDCLASYTATAYWQHGQKTFWTAGDSSELLSQQTSANPKLAGNGPLGLGAYHFPGDHSSCSHHSSGALALATTLLKDR